MRLREALAEVDDGTALRGRALVQELAYGTLRHWGTLDAIAGVLVRKPIADPLLRSLVAVALYQLDHTRAPAFAVVDRAVFAAGALVRPGAKALVNALLRRYLRERTTIGETVRTDDVARWSYPRWWIERVRRDYPECWESVLEAGNARPPLTLRVNLCVTDRESLLQQFSAAGIGAHPVGAAGVIVANPQPVTALPGFDAGAFAVQDLGAQLAAPLLDVAHGNACARRVCSTRRQDGASARNAGYRRRRARCRCRAVAPRPRQPDATSACRPACHDRSRAMRAHRALGGTACRSTGSCSTFPARHRASFAGTPTANGGIGRPTSERFAREQARLADAAWPLLVPGGKLLYATCSVFDAENGDRVTEFLARHPDALRETLTFPADAGHRGGQLLPSPSGASHNQDGFFYARLRKR